MEISISFSVACGFCQTAPAPARDHGGAPCIRPCNCYLLLFNIRITSSTSILIGEISLANRVQRPSNPRKTCWGTGALAYAWVRYSNGVHDGLGTIVYWKNYSIDCIELLYSLLGAPSTPTLSRTSAKCVTRPLKGKHSSEVISS